MTISVSGSPGLPDPSSGTMLKMSIAGPSTGVEDALRRDAAPGGVGGRRGDQRTGNTIAAASRAFIHAPSSRSIGGSLIATNRPRSSRLRLSQCPVGSAHASISRLKMLMVCVFLKRTMMTEGLASP